MPQKVPPVPPLDRSRLRDPAKDAARLLGWFGLAVLMVGAPLVGVLSRRALFILLPIGAGILGMGYLLAVSKAGLRAMRAALLDPVGLAALFLAGWTGLSLIWTLAPAEAAPRLAATLATALVAALIIAHIPERRPRPTLYLLPGGLAVTALATLAMAFLGPASFHGGTEFDPSLLERSILTLVALVWPALGALGAFGRWGLAATLAGLVAVTVTLASASIAMAVFAVAAVAFAAAVDAPRRAARATAVIVAVLIVLAPLVPFVLAPLADAVPMVGRSTVAAMVDWRDLVAGEPLRLVTGHGLDSARRGVVEGDLPAHTPRSILFEVWYDLGLLGAFAFALVLAGALEAIGSAAGHVAPPLLGGAVATVAIALFGVATAELWFVTLASLQAVAFGLLARSSRGGLRPPVVPGTSLETGSAIAPFVAGAAPPR